MQDTKRDGSNFQGYDTQYLIQDSAHSAISLLAKLRSAVIVIVPSLPIWIKKNELHFAEFWSSLLTAYCTMIYSVHHSKRLGKREFNILPSLLSERRKQYPSSKNLTGLV
jgi:hypothetical protein